MAAGYAQSQAQIIIVSQQYGQACVKTVYGPNARVIHTDTFTRTESGTFGTPDLGVAYVYEHGVGDYITLDVDGTRGKITDTSGELYSDYVDINIPVNLVNLDLYFEYTSPDATLDGEAIWFGVRADVDWNSEVGFYIRYSDKDKLVLECWDTGGSQAIELDYIYDLSVTHSWRLVALDEKVYLKVWETSDPEPINWSIELTLTINSLITKAGYVRIEIGTRSLLSTAISYLDNISLIGFFLPISQIGQAQAHIVYRTEEGGYIWPQSGQALAQIVISSNQYSQALAWIGILAFGTLFEDTFTRTTTAPPFNIGTSDSGHTWIWNNYDSSYTEATSPTYVNGSELVLPAYDKYDSMHINGIDTGNNNLYFYFDFYLPAANDNGFTYYIYSRQWTLGVDGSSSNSIINLYANGLNFEIPVVERSTWYRVKAFITPNDGTKISAKLWKVGDEEPQTWAITYAYNPSGGNYDLLLDIYYSPDTEYARLDNFKLESVTTLKYNQGYALAQTIIKQVYSPLAQAQAILNQSMYVAQAMGTIKQVYSMLAQAQAWIKKSWGFGQARVYIPWPIDSYSAKVRADGATHLYGLHQSNHQNGSNTWFDEINNADSNNTNGYYTYSYVMSSPISPERLGISMGYYYNRISWVGNNGSVPMEFLGNTWSIDMWAYSPNQTSGIANIFGSNPSASHYVDMWFGSGTSRAGGNGIALFISSPTTGAVIYNTGITTSTNTWYHIAVTYNNKVFKVYIDGILTNTITRETWAPSTYNIGSYMLSVNHSPYYGFNTNGHYSGYDNISIYPSELTLEQIQDHYGFKSIYTGQAMASINQSKYVAQTQAQIVRTYPNAEGPGPFAQAGTLLNTGLQIAQADVYISPSFDQRVYAQAMVRIVGVFLWAQAQAVIQAQDGLVARVFNGQATSITDVDIGTLFEYYNEVGPLKPDYSSSPLVSPPIGVPDGSWDTWGIIWHGNFVADETGTWSFWLRHDDWAYVGIKNWATNTITVVRNNTGVHAGEFWTISLTEGQQYTLIAGYSNGTGAGYIGLKYSRPSDGGAHHYLTDNDPPWIHASPAYKKAQANSWIVYIDPNSGATVWPTFSQANTYIYYPDVKGYGQAVVQIGAWRPAQAITQIINEIDQYKLAVLADKPILYYPMNESSYTEGLNTIVGRRAGTWSAAGAAFSQPGALLSGTSIDFNGQAAIIPTPPRGGTDVLEALTFPGTYNANGTAANAYKISNQFWLNAGDTVTITLNNVTTTPSGYNMSLGIWKQNDGANSDNQYAYIGTGPQSGTYTRTAAQTGIYFVYIYTSGGATPVPSGSGTVSYPDYNADSSIPIIDGSCVSVEAWIKPDGSNEKMFFGFTHNYIWVRSDGSIGFGDGASHYYMAPAGTVTTGTWYHVVGVMFSGQPCSTGNKLYVNGVAKTLTAAGTNVLRYAAQNFVIGGWNSNTSYRFTAPIDDLSVFNYELTPEQVLAHYRARITLWIAQAQAQIFGHPWYHAQALAQIGMSWGIGQALAYIWAFDYPQFGQAQAVIHGEYGLTRMTWLNTEANRYNVGDIYAWDIEGVAENPQYYRTGWWYYSWLTPSTYVRDEDWGMAWSGVFNITVQDAGTWQFQTYSDDGSELWINNTRVVDNGFGTGHDPATVSGSFVFEEGKTYTIHARWANGGGNFYIRVQYKRPGESTWRYLTSRSLGLNPPWLKHYWFGGFAQAQAYTIGGQNFTNHAQAQAKINAYNVKGYGQAKTTILRPYRVRGQAQVQIGAFWPAQALALIEQTYYRVAQSGTQIGSFKYSQAKVWIKAYGVSRVAQARAFIKVTHEGHGQAQTWIKQTYPLFRLYPNYATIAYGASVDVEPVLEGIGLTIEGFPSYILDENINTFWTSLVDFEGEYITRANIDLGISRTISGYYILPNRYNATVTLEYQVGSNWILVDTIYFDVGINDPVDANKAYRAIIGPITARYWRLTVINGGNDLQISLNSFELGAASIVSATFAQAAAQIGYFAFGQAVVGIYPMGQRFGQAQSRIKQIYSRVAQAQAYIIPPTTFGLAQVVVLQTYSNVAQVIFFIIPPTTFGLALATIAAYNVNGFGQAQTNIITAYYRVGQAHATITKSAGYGYARALIFNRVTLTGQSRVRIGHFQHGLAMALIIAQYKYSQALTTIKTYYTKSAQARVMIQRFERWGQAQTSVIQTYRNPTNTGHAQALLNMGFGLGRARVTILQVYRVQVYSRTWIKTTYVQIAQALTSLFEVHTYTSQANAHISVAHIVTGMSTTQIGYFKYAQTQARILAFNVPKVGNAGCYILVDIDIPNVTPSSDRSSYLISYENQRLPGYTFSESFDSIINIIGYPAPYKDGDITYNQFMYDHAFAAYHSLENKSINLVMTVWELTYETCKLRVQEAATIFKSTRGKFGKLYIQNYNKYYLVIPKHLTIEKEAGTSSQILQYSVTFEAKPWLISNEAYSISGTGTIDTGSRTIADGGWTPARIIVSGTNVEISGLTESGQDTGTIAISGTVTDFVVDTNSFSSDDNSLITPKDYGLYVGPGKTIFTITGATSCIIEWNNRWYL